MLHLGLSQEGSCGGSVQEKDKTKWSVMVISRDTSPPVAKVLTDGQFSRTTLVAYGRDKYFWLPQPQISEDTGLCDE